MFLLLKMAMVPQGGEIPGSSGIRQVHIVVSILILWCFYNFSWSVPCHGHGWQDDMGNRRLLHCLFPALWPVEMPLPGQILRRGWRAEYGSRTCLFNTVITTCFYVCFYCSKGPLCRKMAKMRDIPAAAGWCKTMLNLWFYCVFIRVPCWPFLPVLASWVFTAR